MLSLALALIAALASTVKASDPHVALPSRPPDFYVSSAWVDSNLWDLETQEVGDNCATYEVRVPVAPADTIATTYRQAFDYAYAAEIVVGSNVPPQAFLGGSWNMLTTAHGPNMIAGPGFNAPSCPIPPSYQISAPTAGAANNLALSVWPWGSTAPVWAAGSGLVEAWVPILNPHPITAPGEGVPGGLVAYQQIGLGEMAAWKTTNGVGVIRDEIARTREPRPYHSLWITPSTDPTVSWYSITNGDTYAHGVSYSVRMKARTRIAGWFVKAADVAANPAVLAP